MTKSFFLRLILSFLGLGLLVLLWSLGVHLLQQKLVMAAQLAPEKAFVSLYQLLNQQAILIDILASLRRVLFSLFCALVVGVPVGIAVGVSATINQLSSSSFQFLRMISPLSWMPIAVMVFGIGDAPIYFLLSITAVWPIILNTAAGVRQLNPQWILLSRSFNATLWETLIKVVFPGILSHLLTGVRVAIGMCWVLLIPCEMLGVSSGLGYLILDSRDRLAYSDLMAIIVLIGALGFALDALVQYVQKRIV